VVIKNGTKLNMSISAGKLKLSQVRSGQVGHRLPTPRRLQTRHLDGTGISMGFRASELIEMICAAVQGNDSNERSTGKV
jgi:hypothetical protein